MENIKIGIPVNGDFVGEPGESKSVNIYSLDGNSYKLIESYDNPALKSRAPRGRGAHMLKSLLDRNVNYVILGEIGEPGIRLLKDKIKIFIANNIMVNDALNKFMNNELRETKEATHKSEEHWNEN